MECGWFLLVAGGERGAGEFWSAVRGCDMGRDWILQVAVWRMGAFERRLLALVVDVFVIMQLKFQQSFVEFYKGPQLQFIDRVVLFQLLHRDRAHSANFAKPEIRQCSSLRRS